MQFLLDHHANFMEHVKTKKVCGTKKSLVNQINGCGVMN
jgi:hypothetical protein